MSKDKKKKHKNHDDVKEKDRKKGNDNRQKEFKIPDDVKLMAKMTLKKFKKDNDFYSNKKELKAAYYAYLVDLLPESINFAVRWGHIDSNKETKEAIYAKLADPKFVKVIKKQLKDELEIKNIELLPIMIREILGDAAKAQKQDPENNQFDLTDLLELSSTILKKKMKKMEKAGIDEALAFDVLSVIPSNKILSNTKGQFYHIRVLFQVLYEHAKEKEVNFAKIIDILVKDEDVPAIITFALLERKEKYGSFNEKQRALFTDVTEFCFKSMEKMEKDTIANIIKSYVQARKKDASMNKDSQRRYFLAELPEDTYPKTMKVINKLLKDNEEIKKYL